MYNFYLFNKTKNVKKLFKPKFFKKYLFIKNI